MARMANGQALIQAFEEWAPKRLAVGDDREKIGLQVGSLNKSVKRVMTALDVLENVVDEAIENQVDLIVAHHPLIFRPLKKIATDSSAGRIIEKCLKHNVTVYAAHTNLDVAPGGVNDLLAEALELQNSKVLVPTFDTVLKKIAVFVPKKHAELVRRAIGDAGAGHLGGYSHCTFSSLGKGTFLPTEGSNPYIGTTGHLEQVEEIKLETIVTAEQQSQVIQAMLMAHPYEEVAYDIIPLENKGESLGLGRIGMLQETLTLGAFAEKVKQIFGLESVRFVGDPGDFVKKVAVLGGDGNKFMSTARMKGADVFVTGDVYYHTAHDAWMEGLNIIDPGHNIEKVMKDGVKRFFEAFIEEKQYDVEVLTSKIHTDPFRFI